MKRKTNREQKPAAVEEWSLIEQWTNGEGIDLRLGFVGDKLMHMDQDGKLEQVSVAESVGVLQTIEFLAEKWSLSDGNFDCGSRVRWLGMVAKNMTETQEDNLEFIAETVDHIQHLAGSGIELFEADQAETKEQTDLEKRLHALLVAILSDAGWIESESTGPILWKLRKEKIASAKAA